MMSEQELKEPISQFTKWYNEAVAVETGADIMTLATSSSNGRPSARVVCLRGFDKDGVKFVSNSTSRKAIEIEENPQVAILFYWPQLQRTIRIEGNAMKLSEEESKKMFDSVSEEFKMHFCMYNEKTPATIENNQELIDRYEELKEQMKTTPLSKPIYMGLYCVIPEVVEFLNSQDLFKDRIVFRRPHPGEIADGKLLHQGDEGWVYEKFTPW